MKVNKQWMKVVLHVFALLSSATRDFQHVFICCLFTFIKRESTTFLTPSLLPVRVCRGDIMCCVLFHTHCIAVLPVQIKTVYVYLFILLPVLPNGFLLSQFEAYH